MKLSYTDLAKAIAESGPDNMALNPPPLDAIPPEPSYLERLRDDAAMHIIASMIQGVLLARREMDWPAAWREAFDGADAMLAERGKR
jgi:hypothetical protein